MNQPSKIKVVSPENPPIKLDEFFGEQSIERAAELFDKLEQPIISGLQMGIPIRNLYNWVKVLTDKPNVKRKMYSFIEFVWFKIVEQLREAGLSLERIADFQNGILKPIQVKGLVTLIDQAESYIDELKISEEEKNNLRKFLASSRKDTKGLTEFNLLHIAIMECILKKLPLSFAVFIDGSFIILDKSKEHSYTEQDKNKLLFETHIVVSVAKIIQNFLLSDLADWVVPEINLLSPQENKLFSLLHSGKYESIIIKFKDKKMKSLELKRSENPKEKIVNLIRDGEFSEILVKKNKGEIEKIENTIKIVL
jgi:hypothetical protein